MSITFTVRGQKMQPVAIPETDELPEALQRVYSAVVSACGDGSPDPYLEARIADAVLNALVEDRDFEIGEVLSAE